MSNAVATRPAFSPVKAPQLTESQRRLLADPFHLGDTIPAWEPPAVLPDSARMRAVKAELERGLQAPTPGHVEWCVRKLFALPSRNATELDKAFQTDNFIDACGQYPDDLWTWGTTELLRTKIFRPSPAELVAIVEPKHGERQRMLERLNLMLNGGRAAVVAPPPEPETRLQRMRITRGLYEKHNRPLDVARVDREIAAEEARERGEKPSAPVAEPVNREPFKPADTPTNRRMAELARAKRSEPPPAEYRDVAEA